ncbi:MAG: hypothetical protein NVV74_15870 [Magnetospirillum sp.]|nr:hypothetical protein [Magnetospirillum sp.]
MGAVLTSPYFHLSILITALTSPIWVATKWWELSISVLPNIVGFTIGGYAILVSFGDEEFKRKIAGKTDEDDGDSPYMHVNATLVHTIIVQATALLISIIFKGLSFISYAEISEAKDWSLISVVPGVILSAPAFLLFAYGLVLLIPLSINIFEVASWYDDDQTGQRVAKCKAPPQPVSQKVPAPVDEG